MDKIASNGEKFPILMLSLHRYNPLKIFPVA